VRGDIEPIFDELKEESKSSQSELPLLEKELRQLQREVGRLVDALAASDDKSDAIVKGIAERNERIKELDGRIRTARLAPEAIQTDFALMEAGVKDRLRHLRETLARNPTEGRAFLAQIFPGHLRVKPLRTAYGGLFDITGKALLSPAVADLSSSCRP